MKVKSLFTAMLLFVASLATTAQEAKYKIKSAIIKESMEAMGQKMEMIQYFDNYGKDEAVDIKMPMQGVADVKLTMRSIQKGDSIFSINLEYKTGKKTVLPEKQINYLKLTPEIVEKYKLQEIGTEEFLGKQCKKYKSEISTAGTTSFVTSWIWKGLVLKAVISANGMTMTTTVTEIQENANIATETFVIPDNIVFQ